MSTPKERTLPLWRLRWARRLLGIGAKTGYRAEIHGNTVTTWTGETGNWYDATEFITYTHGKDVRP